MILQGKKRDNRVREEKKESWVVSGYDYDYEYDCDYKVKEPPSPVPPPPPPPPPSTKKAPKAVDEDLYKISPELLYAKSKTVTSPIFIIITIAHMY